jgi:hypothetical protein
MVTQCRAWASHVSSALHCCGSSIAHGPSRQHGKGVRRHTPAQHVQASRSCDATLLGRRHHATVLYPPRPTHMQAPPTTHNTSTYPPAPSATPPHTQDNQGCNPRVQPNPLVDFVAQACSKRRVVTVRRTPFVPKLQPRSCATHHPHKQYTRTCATNTLLSPPHTHPKPRAARGRYSAQLWVVITQACSLHYVATVGAQHQRCPGPTTSTWGTSANGTAAWCRASTLQPHSLLHTLTPRNRKQPLPVNLHRQEATIQAALITLPGLVQDDSSNTGWCVGYMLYGHPCCDVGKPAAEIRNHTHAHTGQQAVCTQVT